MAKGKKSDLATRKKIYEMTVEINSKDQLLHDYIKGNRELTNKIQQMDNYKKMVDEYNQSKTEHSLLQQKIDTLQQSLELMEKFNKTLVKNILANEDFKISWETIEVMRQFDLLPDEFKQTRTQRRNMSKNAVDFQASISDGLKQLKGIGFKYGVQS